MTSTYEIPDGSIVSVRLNGNDYSMISSHPNPHIGDLVTIDEQNPGKVKPAHIQEQILGVITEVVEEPYVHPLRLLAWKKLKEMKEQTKHD